jgi:hypothetical protein
MRFIYFLLILSIVGLLRPYRVNTTFNELFLSERQLDKIVSENGKYFVYYNIHNIG